MPTPEELFTKLNGGDKFTKLDLSNAYQQVVLDEESQPFVTITTHLGLYRYTRLPFGVAAAPAIFQKIMDKLLNGLSQTGVILDDLIVTGEDDAQHVSNLRKTLEKLERSGVKLKKSKCAIMQPKIEYFAFIVDRHGIHPLQAKVKAIKEVQEPQNKTELQSFLGWLIITGSSSQTCLTGKSAQQAVGQGHTMVLESRVHQVVSESKEHSDLVTCVSTLQS